MGTSSSREPEVLLPTLDFLSSRCRFPHIPGPSPVPDRVMRALCLPAIDHRGPEFAAVGLKVLRGACENFEAWVPAHARAAWVERLYVAMGLGKLAGTMFRIGPSGRWQ